MDEGDDVVEDLFAVRLVEDLVGGALVDPLVEVAAADALDRRPRRTRAARARPRSPWIQSVGSSPSDAVLGDRGDAGEERDQRLPLERPVVDERVGGVGLRRPPGRGRGSTGSIGTSGIGSMPSSASIVGIAADHGAGEHQRAELVAVLLGVARRDQAAHRVADQDDRQAGVLAPRELGDRVQVRGQVLAVARSGPARRRSDRGRGGRARRRPRPRRRAARRRARSGRCAPRSRARAARGSVASGFGQVRT